MQRSFKVLVVSFASCFFFQSVLLEGCSVDRTDLEGILSGLSYVSPSLVDDSFIGPVDFINSSGVKDVKFQNGTYLSVELLSNGTIKVSTNDNFKDYEHLEIGTRIKDVLEIKCEGETFKKEFVQPINDINNHSPEFNRKEYKFVFYGQLPSDFDMTSLIEISASDSDCSAPNLRFSMEDKADPKNQHLEIYNYYKEGKTSYPKLKTKQKIIPPFKAEYYLTVMDYYFGTGKSTNATLLFEVLNSDEDIEFESDTYLGFVGEMTLDINFEQDIKLKNGIDKEAKVEIEESAYSKYFDVKIDLQNGMIRVKLNDFLPEVPQLRSASKIQLKLKAKWRNIEAETNLIIRAEKEIGKLCEVPGFDLSSGYYMSRSDVEDVFVGRILTIENTLNVANMKCSQSKYLKCFFDKDNNRFIMETTEEFKTSYEIEENENIVTTSVSVECPYGEYEIEFHQRIKDTNNHAPEFLKDEYTFLFYNEIPKSFDMTSMNVISARDYDIGTHYCDFELDQEGSKYFEASYVSSVKDKICSSILTPKKVLVAPFNSTFTFTVSDKGSPPKKDETTIKINLVTDKGQIFQFTKKEYKFFLQEENMTFYTEKEEAFIEMENGFDRTAVFEIASPELSKVVGIKVNILNKKLELYFLDIPKAQEMFKESVKSVVIPIKATWKGFTAITNVKILRSSDLNSNEGNSNSNFAKNMDGFSTYILVSTIGITCSFAITGVLLLVLIYLVKKQLIRPQIVTEQRVNYFTEKV